MINIRVAINNSTKKWFLLNSYFKLAKINLAQTTMYAAFFSIRIMINNVKTGDTHLIIYFKYPSNHIKSVQYFNRHNPYYESLISLIASSTLPRAGITTLVSPFIANPRLILHTSLSVPIYKSLFIYFLFTSVRGVRYEYNKCAFNCRTM